MKKEIILGEIRADWFLTIMKHIRKHGIGNEYGEITGFCGFIYNHKIFKNLNLYNWKIKISLINRCEKQNKDDFGTI